MARNTNFYYSFLVLPREKREAIVAVWDFCRAVDDVVDESRATPAEQRQGLETWRREVAETFEGRAPGTPQGRALQQQLRRFPLPRQAFEELIDGVQMDADARRYDTLAELEVYCYHVASTVGLMCLEIFGYRSPATRDYAVTLGKALQLTNILRDVGADAHAGRVYLPLADLELAGCSVEELKGSSPAAGLLTVLRNVAGRARQLYGEANRLCPPEDRRRLVAAEIMAATYRALLDDIERGGFQVLGPPLRLTRARKARLALATWVSTMLSLRVPKVS